MQRTPSIRLVWIAVVVMAFVISVMIGAGSAQSASVGTCETEDCEQDTLDESITTMVDRVGEETDTEVNSSVSNSESSTSSTESSTVSTEVSTNSTDSLTTVNTNTSVSTSTHSD